MAPRAQPAALHTEVDVFFAGQAIRGFVRADREPPFAIGFAPLAPAVSRSLEGTELGGGTSTLRPAEGLSAGVRGCATMCSVMGLTRNDVGGLVGHKLSLAGLVHAASQGRTYFI